MKINAIIRALILGVATVTSADAFAEVWTLDSCIAYAHEHNTDIRLRRVDGLTAEYSVTEAKDGFLPTVRAYANQGFDFGRGLTSENTYANRNTSSFSVGASMNVPLFQGLAGVRRLAYSKANLRTALEQVEAAKDDVTLNIIAQYLQVLYNKEMRDVAEEQARLSEVELNRRKELLDGGKIPELDLLQAESQLAADRYSAVSAANDVAISISNLLQMLQMPYDPDFDVAPVSDPEGLLPSVDEVFANAMSNNHGMRAARLAVDAAERNVSLSRTGYIPTLSFSAGLGTNYYHVSGFENNSFGSQMRDNFAKSIGFSLSIPIFDAFSTRNNERRARAAVLSASLQADNQRITLYNNISQAHVLATAARRRCVSGEVAEKAAEAAFEAMQEKYNFGRANATEFEQTKTALFKARADLVQSRYEAILRARILNFYNRAD